MFLYRNILSAGSTDKFSGHTYTHTHTHTYTYTQYSRINSIVIGFMERNILYNEDF